MTMTNQQLLDSFLRHISKMEVQIEELKHLVQTVAESESTEAVAVLQKENQSLRERLREQDIMNYIESKSHDKR